MDEEPVEILAGMAERGEVDPWNIDIVDVTDGSLPNLNAEGADTVSGRNSLR